MKTNAIEKQISAARATFSVALILLLSSCDFDLSSLRLPFMKNREEQIVVEEPVIPPLEAGVTEQEVRALLGEPSGFMKIGNKTTLLYKGEALEFINGKLTKSITNLQNRIEIRERASRENLGIIIEGDELVLQEKNQAASLPKIDTPKLGRIVGVVLRDSQGNPIDHSALLTKGKITVVQFYATWCKPCKQLAPLLEEIVSGQDDVVLKKVDIGEWGSKITTQYNVSSIPDVRVFDALGRLIAPPTFEPDKISKQIERARIQ